MTGTGADPSDSTQQAATEIASLIAEARRLHHAGRLDEAQQLCRRVLLEHPGQPEALYRLARIAQFAGQLPLAAGLLLQAVAARPRNRAFNKVLGDVLQAHGRPAQAITSYEQALLADATDPETHHNLGVAMLQTGQPEQAVSRLRHALSLAPDRAEFHSNILLAQQYVSGIDRGARYKGALDWARRYAANTQDQHHTNTPDAGRRLRVGYVSPDFRRHPVGLFLEPVLLAHDPAEVEIFCYANNWRADEMTARLRSATHQWRTIAGFSDEEAAELIRTDAIDILVDLAGHTAGNRLPLFARKPAPIQATWAGYSDTTGLAAIDCFIGDRFVCPAYAGEERFFTERIVRLPAYFLCYRPQPGAPDVAPPPLLSARRITFGCFNSVAKVNAEVVAAWSEILRQVPEAQLCLKTDALGDAAVRERYRRVFVERGVSKDRLVMLPRSSSWSDYASAFAQIDIALDPFPFNGGTTSMDGLWMGVPLVSYAGDRCVSRMGAGILSSVGLESLVSDSLSAYVRSAVALARDPERIVELRATLRQKLLDSPLCDCVEFTRSLETLYRSMWRDWCASH